MEFLRVLMIRKIMLQYRWTVEQQLLKGNCNPLGPMKSSKRLDTNENMAPCLSARVCIVVLCVEDGKVVRWGCIVVLWVEDGIVVLCVSIVVLLVEDGIVVFLVCIVVLWVEDAIVILCAA